MRGEISAELAATLVAAQFPQWAGLSVVAVALDGWDNTTYRLGDELTVRLPSAEAYAAQVDKEHRWLPVLAHHLPLAIPEPVGRGEPSERFPRPWSIYRWIEGEVATVARIGDLDAFAGALGAFLAALQHIDATDGPPPGPHCFWRGGRLDVYDGEAREAIARLAGRIDTGAATAVWEEALASTWQHPPVWVHGDVAPSNLLVDGGRLRAVLDFGCAAVGDPACDLVLAWTFLDDAATEVFADAVALDEATWARARGWALWKAAITLAQHEDPDRTARRGGWRGGAADVLERVVAVRPGFLDRSG